MNATAELGSGCAEQAPTKPSFRSGSKPTSRASARKRERGFGASRAADGAGPKKSCFLSRFQASRRSSNY